MSDYRPVVGREVRSSRGNEIGEVKNVVMTEGGKNVKALLGVGGFLGIGEKDVLVEMDKIRFDPKSDYVTYLGTEKELEAMAEYDQPDEREDRYTYRRGYYGRYDRFNDRYYSGNDHGYYDGRRHGRQYYLDDSSNRYRDRYHHNDNMMDRRNRSYDSRSYDSRSYDNRYDRQNYDDNNRSRSGSYYYND